MEVGHGAGGHRGGIWAGREQVFERVDKGGRGEYGGAGALRIEDVQAAAGRGEGLVELQARGGDGVGFILAECTALVVV